MTSKYFCAAAAVAFLCAGSAIAAPKPAAAPKAAEPAAQPAALPPLTQGPPIPGLCIYNRDAAVGSSTAGKAMLARMQQLRAQAAAELQAEQTALKTDIDAFVAKRSTLTQEQVAQQAQPLQQRQEAFNRKAELRNQELEATGEKALARFEQGVLPILRTVYQQRNCTILLRGDIIMAVNPAMDLTPLAVTQLNTTMPTMTFDREILPQR